jgi:four helix bundle protein
MSSLSNIASNFARAKITSYRDLIVWARAMDLVVNCYKLSKRLPNSETYGLISQIRMAAISVPANIAEGHGRRSLGEYVQHLSIANGSLKELETHLLITGRLNYLRHDEIVGALKACEEIGRMLSTLIQKLRQKRL